MFTMKTKKNLGVNEFALEMPVSYNKSQQKCVKSENISTFRQMTSYLDLVEHDETEFAICVQSLCNNC